MYKFPAGKQHLTGDGTGTGTSTEYLLTNKIMARNGW